MACHTVLHRGVDSPKQAVQSSDFLPPPPKSSTTDLFFPHGHFSCQQWLGFSAEGRSCQPCPLSSCVQVHTRPSSQQDHTQPTGFQEHTLEGILMSWTHAELPSLAAISVICWLSKAHSGLLFSLDTVDRHRFYVPTLLYFWHSSHRIAGQRKTSSSNRGCFLHVSVLPQSSLN